MINIPLNVSIENMIGTSVSVVNLILCIHILPFRRADLTASASLQGIRSEGPRLHALCLAPPAILSRE
jgi:hypothetical protein